MLINKQMDSCESTYEQLVLEVAEIIDSIPYDNDTTNCINN